MSANDHHRTQHHVSISSDVAVPNEVLAHAHNRHRQAHLAEDVIDKQPSAQTTTHHVPSSVAVGSSSSSASETRQPFDGGCWRPQMNREAVLKRGKVPRFDGRSLKDWDRVHKHKIDELKQALHIGEVHSESHNSNSDSLKGESASSSHRHLPILARAEIEKHNTMDDLWMVIHNVVYDVTVWQNFHPGGESILRDCGGKDVTDLYNFYHPWVTCEGMIGAYAVGFLRTEDQHHHHHHEKESGEVAKGAESSAGDETEDDGAAKDPLDELLEDEDEVKNA